MESTEEKDKPMKVHRILSETSKSNYWTRSFWRFHCQTCCLLDLSACHQNDTLVDADGLEKYAK